MAKSAANEQTLGALHSKLATVFQKVLQRYADRMDAVTAIAEGAVDLESEVLQELLSTGSDPNPAMLSAISKFLKDNEIMYDSEELDALSSLERQLADKRAKRDNVVSLKNLKAVGE